MLKTNKNIITIRKEAFTQTPSWRKILSLPFIYGVVVPLVFLDICAEIYHQICFRLYGLKPIRRRDYIAIDRPRLKKLSFFEKLACAYCGYANGLAAYLVAIAAETEAYWCAIMHQNKNIIANQPHQKEFLNREDFN